MTEKQETPTDQGLTRRSVLRRGTIAAAAGAVGVGTFAVPVAATACPRTPGYWKNHAWPESWDNVNRLDGIDFATPEEGRAFLREAKDGDKGDIMAFHLIATILNFQISCGGDRPNNDVDAPVADVIGPEEDDDISVDGWEGEETVREIKRLAEDWLSASNFPDSQETWIVEDALVEDGEVLKDLLDAYNNNTLVECTCEEEKEFENVTGGDS